MNAEERLERIQSFGRGFEILVDALGQFPRDMWRYKPAPDVWSIQEIALHIADGEANGYVRIRKCLAEPGQPVMAYAGEQWAEALRYSEQNLDEALETFRWLRLSTCRLLTSVPEAAWSNTIEHPESGTLSLDDLLHIYERHVPDHVEQMWAVYADWMKQL